MKFKKTAIVICGLALAGLLVWLFVRHKSEASRFVGDWTNKDFETRNITRINVRMDGDQIKVHAWGRCHPIECDWGETNATLHRQALSVMWDQKFAIQTQDIALAPDGTMQIKTHLVSTLRGRKDRDYECVLVKGLVHNWSDPKVAN
jgi:hypothetical protein